MRSSEDCDLSRLQSQRRSSWNEISCQRITCVCGENSWLGFIDITTLNQVHHHHLVGSILSICQGLSNSQSIAWFLDTTVFKILATLRLDIFDAWQMCEAYIFWQSEKVQMRDLYVVIWLSEIDWALVIGKVGFVLCGLLSARHEPEFYFDTFFSQACTYSQRVRRGAKTALKLNTILSVCQLIVGMLAWQSLVSAVGVWTRIYRLAFVFALWEEERWHPQSVAFSREFCP